jgi:chromosomal replication initiator protein
MVRTAEEAWRQCLRQIENDVGKRTYKTWFEPLQPTDLERSDNEIRLTVEIPSQFFYEWLDAHYCGLIDAALKEVVGPDAKLSYVVNKELADGEGDGVATVEPMLSPSSSTPATPESTRPSSPPAVSEPPVTAEPVEPVESNLNTRYRFDNFIEGACNRLARSSARAIANNPGETSFNPFLVYGAVGLGKTHLVQAIGNHVRKARGEECQIRYVSGERFTTEFVQAIQENKIASFSTFYREIDVLIVDDVQFFGGKEKTQEEFFHLFNALHQSGKQIILCADRQPKDIPGIEERLLSRFQWGLTADVQTPKFETRVAILQSKMESNDVTLPMNVVEFVAKQITHNIRALEGAVNRLKIYREINDTELTPGVVKRVLKDLVRKRSMRASIRDIQSSTADLFDVEEKKLRSRTRTRNVVQARQVAMYLCRKYTDETLQKIGKEFGGRDHSTVIHSIDTVEDLVDTDPNFRDRVQELQNELDTGNPRVTA